MPYQTVKVPDEEMPVFLEKSLDDKFKPKAEWRTTFLTGKRAQEEVIGEIGDLKEGVLKIKTQLDVDSDFGSKIPILLYLEASEVKKIMERERKFNKDFSKLGLIERLRGFFCSYDFNKFYKCEKCGGYIAGDVVPRKYNEIGHMAGSAGTDYDCPRCGDTLARHATIHS